LKDIAAKDIRNISSTALSGIYSLLWILSFYEIKRYLFSLIIVDVI